MAPARMALVSTSWSACIVSITTLESVPSAFTWRHASTPSQFGIDTSIRMTSGDSSSARRTA